MTSPRQLAFLLIATLMAGCSDPMINPEHSSPILNRGPHQGALRQIEGADGFVEVVTEPVRDAPSGSPKFRVAVYFLNRDRTAPLVPAPTAVEMTATWPDEPSPASIHLIIDPVPGDPAGMAKFVAPAADHKGEPNGTVRAQLNDKAIAAAL